MDVVLALLLLITGYLAGSLNFAIILTRIVSGGDIRSLGNENAGTANVARNVGKGWAALVFFGDIAKAVFPMMLARSVFSGASPAHHGVVVLVGIAAVLGHCKPVYFGFRGGGGIATTFGAISFIAPAELLIAMILGFVATRIIVKAKEYRLGRWTSGMILLLIPAAITVSSVFPGISLGGRYRLGGHEWYVVVGAWIAVGFTISLNARLFGGYIKSLFSSA